MDAECGHGCGGVVMWWVCGYVVVGDVMCGVVDIRWLVLRCVTGLHGPHVLIGIIMLSTV